MSAAEQAVLYGRRLGRLTIWDAVTGRAGVAVWDESMRALVALSASQAALLLASDEEICFEWRKWNGMTGGRGRLIVIEPMRCQRLLDEASHP